MPNKCPCCSSKPYSQCCQPVIEGHPAADPEALMRSRYTAYTLEKWEYIHSSWHPDTRPSRIRPMETDWIGLTIVRAEADIVEFIAGFRENGKIMALREISRFAAANGQWHYLDGNHKVEESGRNDPCPCGSGRKTKQCCANPKPRDT